MELLAWVLAVGAFASVVSIIAWLLGEGEESSNAPRAVGETAAADVAPPPAEPEHYPDLPSSHLLVGAPIVPSGAADPYREDGHVVTLQDWLVHLHPDGSGVWTDVVREFYAAAAEDPVVGDYFHGVDEEGLHRHFLAALIMFTGTGLTVGAYRRMRAEHRGVRNRDGRPITPQVFDAAIGVLVDILRRRGVPAETLRQVEFVLAPLRDAIAVPVPPVPSARVEEGGW